MHRSLISGANYNGQVYEDISLTPNFESTYRLTVNLQGKDFRELEFGSKITFLWSEDIPDARFDKTLKIQPAPVPVAKFDSPIPREWHPLPAYGEFSG